MTPTPGRPVFVPLPALDIADYARYLLERGWRLELDDSMEFGYLCFAPSDDPAGCGRKFRDAVQRQSEFDLAAHFDYLFATHYELDLPPPTKEHPDAEHPPVNPG